ncbi:hypothetical protein V2J09_017544 [Rumex salicifolius]
MLPIQSLYVSHSFSSPISFIHFDLSYGLIQLAQGTPRVQVHNLIDMKDLPVFNSSLSSSSSSTCLSTLDIGAEEWDVADEGAHEILSLIQPNVISERRRKEIIKYIQILIGSSYGIRVFPVGSVPLKTYLPDGDIDLTVVCHHDEELMLSVFYSLLENEEMTNTEIQVRNVQYIPAQVDQLLGKDHLFKRSVILIKSWCFYESRILGAHYGLISTYALETMVIHIINLFHSTLCSPLAVLYKFLTYFSQFDWDDYCLSVDGVMLLSSLPKVVVQLPEGSDDPLLSADFLQKCKETYLVSAGNNQTEQDQFHAKFLNIMDPLSSINNLGRSVNKANYSRIKFALSYASEKLEAIFALHPDKISEGMAIFFRTTLQRNAKRALPDVVPVQDLGDERSDPSETSDENENLLAGIQYGLWSHDYGMYQSESDPMSPQNSSRLAKSRGTGTYIPQPVHISEWNLLQRRRRPDSPRPSKPMPKEAEPPRADANKSILTADDGINRAMHLNLTEFPLLPGTKPVEINIAYPTKRQHLAALATESSSLDSIKSETTQTSKNPAASPILPTLPCPAFLPMQDSPTVDPPLSLIEEKEEKK